MSRVAVHRLNFFLGQVSHKASRCTDNESAGGDGFSFGYETAGTNDGVFLHDGAVENNCSHADECTFFDGAAVKHRAVTDGDIFFNHARKAFFRVNDGIVLNVAAGAYGDGFQIASKNCSGPDA